ESGRCHKCDPWSKGSLPEGNQKQIFISAGTGHLPTQPLWPRSLVRYGIRKRNQRSNKVFKTASSAVGLQRSSAILPKRPERAIRRPSHEGAWRSSKTAGAP